jgi:hypothetical protein
MVAVLPKRIVLELFKASGRFGRRVDPACAHRRQLKEVGRKGEWMRRSVGVICPLR